MNKKILLTGANGFVGRALTKSPCAKSSEVLCTVRRRESGQGDEFLEVGDINADTDWSSALKGVDCVIHLAARAHVMKDDETSPLAIYRQVNTEGTLNLARQAASLGVGRFIFISSIKVNGEATSGLSAFTESVHSISQDPYAVSKMEAENELHTLSEETGIEIVIIRPPLVYGPGVKANFLNLMKLSKTGFPLPFGAVNNARSMVYVDNLVDFVFKCTEDSRAANQTFLVSDDNDLSLTRLVKMLRSSMDTPARLIPIPVYFIRILGALVAKPMVAERLVGSLRLDVSKAKSRLNWRPPYSVEQGIQATVADFLAGNK